MCVVCVCGVCVCVCVGCALFRFSSIMYVICWPVRFCISHASYVSNMFWLGLRVVIACMCEVLGVLCRAHVVTYVIAWFSFGQCVTCDVSCAVAPHM